MKRQRIKEAVSSKAKKQPADEKVDKNRIVAVAKKASVAAQSPSSSRKQVKYRYLTIKKATDEVLMPEKLKMANDFMRDYSLPTE